MSLTHCEERTILDLVEVVLNYEFLTNSHSKQMIMLVQEN